MATLEKEKEEALLASKDSADELFRLQKLTS
jgi:hypothetical protein